MNTQKPLWLVLFFYQNLRSPATPNFGPKTCAHPFSCAPIFLGNAQNENCSQKLGVGKLVGLPSIVKGKTVSTQVVIHWIRKIRLPCKFRHFLSFPLQFLNLRTTFPLWIKLPLFPPFIPPFISHQRTSATSIRLRALCKENLSSWGSWSKEVIRAKTPWLFLDFTEAEAFFFRDHFWQMIHMIFLPWQASTGFQKKNSLPPVASPVRKLNPHKKDYDN